MKSVLSKFNGSNGKVIIAVDPGAAGAIAIYAGGKLSTMTLDRGDADVRAFILAAQVTEHTYAYMEQVQGYIGKEQPGSAMFNFGDGYGFMRGLFCAFDIPCQLIPPQKWMRMVAPGVIGMDYAVRKRALKELAQFWWPELDVTLKLADALCLLRCALSGGDPVAKDGDTGGRSRANYPSDAKAFKRYCKALKLAVPKGSEFMQALNWWVEQGRPEKKTAAPVKERRLCT